MSTSATFAANAGDPALSGRCLGEFVVRQKLGQGGFGEVYLAEQPLLERQAVIKVLRSQRAQDPLHVQRFLREARLASQLDHPYAAHIYAFGAEPDGLFWIAMEYVRGVTLASLLALQGPLPLGRLVPLVARICEVVHTAHQQGIIHRDLKPSNVMVLSRAGRLLPKLLDFGIAKLAQAPASAPAPAGAISAPRWASPTAAVTLRVAPPQDTGATGDRELDPEETILSYRGLAARDQITAVGTVIGSPHAMAPEQWTDAVSVDARCDIYALGILIYQALTGRHVFPGDDLAALAEAHLHQAPPPLGASFPAALDAVLGRALAKERAERYPSALALAQALQQAAGMSPSPPVPQLDDTLRDAVLGSFPQPLAETLARLEAARTLHQAHGAVVQTWHLVARYLGLLALAGTTRLAAPALATLAPQPDEPLRRLRQRGLDAEAWIELGRTLMAPFAGHADAFVLPELVCFFFPADPERPAPCRSLEELGRLGARAEAMIDEAELLALFTDELAALERLLGALSFLAAYVLVVPRDNDRERWMGVRRPARAVVRAPHPESEREALMPGRPVLLDRDGAPLLQLWPLFQVAEPAPGLPEELFLLEGGVRDTPALAALHAWPAGLQKSDAELWNEFDHLLDASEEAPVPHAAAERSPYLGLASFGREDHARFFGREREIETLRNRLQLQPLIAVVGSSGSGKSSLVHAGLMAALPPGWQTLSLRPGAAPLASLGVRLQREGILRVDERALADPQGDPWLLGRALREHALRQQTTLLLCIDQLEEMFTLCSDPAERRRYAELLMHAGRSAEEPVRIVLTLRDDFLLRAEQLEPFRTRLGQCLQLVGTPAPAELLRILIEPAWRAGYTFDDDALAGEMVRAVADAPGALALLSFTADRLFELRDRHFHRLARSAYQRLGGVGGALAQHAEEMLAGLTAPEQRLVREAFRHLITGEGTRAVLARGELLRLLGGDDRAQVVLERLISARLLVATAADTSSEEHLEIIHEALLSAWPRLRDWQSEDREGARLRDQLRSAAQQWDARGRPQGLLWRDEALAELRRWRARSPGPLTDIEEAFEAAILASDTRRRRRRLGGFIAAISVLSLALLVTLLAAQRARDNERQARERLLLLYEEQGRQLMLAGDPVRALVYLDAVQRGGRHSAGLRFLITRAIAALAAEQRALRGHQSRVWSVAVSPDGTQLATASGDGTARVWDARSGETRHTLRGHQGEVFTVEFSPDGALLCTTGEDPDARLWDVRSGQLRHRLAGQGQGQGRIGPCAFSSDGRSVVTAAQDGVARIWNTASGHLVRAIAAGAIGLRSAGFSPDGTQLVTAAWNRETRLWRSDTGQAIARLEDGSYPPELAGGAAVQSSPNLSPSFGQAAAARFSPDGTRLVVLGLGLTARLFRARDGQLEHVLGGHTRLLRSAAFSPDGNTLVTASEDHTAQLWNARTGTAIARLAGHSDSLNRAFFTPDGRRIVTVSDDGTARLWDVTGAALATFAGHLGRVTAGAYATAAHALVTASFDGTARLWDIDWRDATRLQLPATAWSGVFTPAGTALVTLSDDGRLRRWQPDSGRTQTVADQVGVVIGVDRAGHRVMVAGARDLHWVDLTTGRQRQALQPDHETTTAALDPYARSLAVADTLGQLSVYAIVGPVPQVRWRLQLGGPGSILHAITFSPDGRQLAVGTHDRKAYIINATGRIIRTLAEHGGAVLSVAFHPDGERLLTGGADQTVRLWRLGDGQLLQVGQIHRRQINRVAFHPAGVFYAAAGDDEQTTVWETETGNLLARLPAHAAPWVEFSPTGNALAVAELDGSVAIWPIPWVAARSSSLPAGSSPSAELERTLKCRVPFTLNQGRLVPRLQDASGCLR